MTTFTHRLDRTIVIRARPAAVFRFFSNNDDWAAWWGAGSTIDAQPGGRLMIRQPGGDASGEVLEVQQPARIVFTYGYASGKPIPPGGSRVTIRLDVHLAGTLLHLTHELPDEAARDQHVQGWRFQLSLLANAIANRANATAAETVDRWFAVWSNPDTSSRERALAGIGTAEIRFHDRFSSIAGEDDLKAHLAAVHRFMPGLRLERRGDVRHCQWRVLADWVAVAADGQERGRGTNLFLLDADGRIEAVTGFWNA